MADDRDSREKQADDAERRQREREIKEEIERGDEPEPSVDTSELAYFEMELETVTFPATGPMSSQRLAIAKSNHTVGRNFVNI